MALDGMTFPIPLPVILSKGEEEPASLDEQKEQTDILDEQNKRDQEYMRLFGIDSKKEDKLRKEESKLNKLRDKLQKQWDKLGINRFFKTLLGKIGLMAVGLAAMSGGFLSGLLNDLMELMLFAAVDPNGGLLGSFINAIIPLFVNLLSMIAKILINLIPKIIKMLVKLIPVFLQAIGMIINALIDALPLVIDALILAVPLIFKALVEATPKIVSAIMDGVIKIMASLGEAFPWLKSLTDFVTSIASAVKELFSGEGDIKTRIQKFVGSVFDAFLTFVTEGIGNLLGGIKDKLKEAFPGFEKLIDFLGNFLKVIGYVALAIGALILAFKIFAVIAVIIAAWPFILAGLLIAGLIGLIALVMTYWDDMVGWVSKSWDDFMGWIFDNWDAIIEGVTGAMKLLMLPFTWPIELGMYVFKNWKKIKENMIKLLEGLWKTVKDIWQNIKDVFSGKISVGDALRNVISNAFKNIPGLNTIRQFFSDIADWFSQKMSMFGLGGKDSLSGLAATVDKGLGGANIEDRYSQFIQYSLEKGYGGEALKKAAMDQFGDKELADNLDALIGELRAKGVSTTVAGDTSEKGLKQLGDTISSALKASTKAQKALVGVIKSSNTVKK